MIQFFKNLITFFIMTQVFKIPNKFYQFFKMLLLVNYF